MSRAHDAERGRQSREAQPSERAAPGKQTLAGRPRRERGGRAAFAELATLLRERAKEIIRLDAGALRALADFCGRHRRTEVASLALDGELLGLLRQLDAAPDQPLEERWRGLFAALRGDAPPARKDDDPATQLRELVRSGDPDEPVFGERALALLRPATAAQLEPLRHDEKVLAALRASGEREKLAALLGVGGKPPEQKKEAKPVPEGGRPEDWARRLDEALALGADRPWAARDHQAVRNATDGAQAAARRAQALREQGADQNAPRLEQFLERVRHALQRGAQLHGSYPSLARVLDEGSAAPPESLPAGGDTLIERLENAPPDELIGEWADADGDRQLASTRLRQTRAAQHGRLRRDRVEALERELPAQVLPRVLARLKKRLAELAALSPETVEPQEKEKAPPEQAPPAIEPREGNQRGRHD